MLYLTTHRQVRFTLDPLSPINGIFKHEQIVLTVQYNLRMQLQNRKGQVHYAFHSQ